MGITCSRIGPLLVTVALVCLTSPVFGISAREILDESARRNLMDSFRVGVLIKNLKKTKMVSEHFLWLVGVNNSDGTTLFIEFEEPEEARGMRFLSKFPPRDSVDRPKSFSFIPVTGAVVPMKVGDTSADVGGTGMTIDDFRGFVPATSGEPKILREEDVGDRRCYVIEAQTQGTDHRTLIWISKEQFLVVKTQRFSSTNKLEREFLVLEFFTTDDGQLWPRKEEILVPRDDTRIIVEQQAGVYHMHVPEDLMNPETFATFKWRVQAE